MGRERIVTLAMLVLVISVIIIAIPVSAKLVATAKAKNTTSMEMNVDILQNNSYNVTVTAYELVVVLASTNEQSLATTAGKFVAPSMMAVPLANAVVWLYANDVPYALGWTDINGKVNFLVKVDPQAVKLDSKGCVEIYAVYEGDENHLPTRGRSEIVCKDSMLLIIPALQETTKAVQKDENLQNACMMFFVLLGFMIAGLYASGKDPLRLLDITTPRLPAARRKPEIRLQLTEDKFKSLRMAHLAGEKELNSSIKNTASQIAKNASSIKSIKDLLERKRAEYRLYDEIMGKVDEMKREALEKLKKETANLTPKEAAMVDKKNFEALYKNIGEELARRAYDLIKDPEDRTRKSIDKFWGESGMMQDKIKKIAEARHLADLVSLTERGPTRKMGPLGYTGAISDIRRHVEATTGIGYAVRVVDNVRGFVNMAVQYGKYLGKYVPAGSKYAATKWKEEMARKEVEALHEQMWKKQEEFEDIREKARQLDAAVPIQSTQLGKEWVRKEEEIRGVEAKLAVAEAKLKEAQKKKKEAWAAFEPIYYEGIVMPDIVITEKRATISTGMLAKDVLNSINHRLFYELKERGLMTEKEIDKFNGSLQEEADIAKRRARIQEKFHELGNDALFDEIMNEKLYVEITAYDDKERGFYKDEERSGEYTLQNIAEVAEQNVLSTTPEGAAFIVGAARSIADHAVKFEAFTETQDQQLRRYIEIDEFVKKEIIDTCVRKGMAAGIERLKKEEKIESGEKIRETHAAYIGDETLFELWGKRVGKKHERFKERLKNITQEELYYIASSYAFKHALAQINKLLASGNIDPNSKDMNLVKMHYAREMSEIYKRKMEEDAHRRRVGRIMEQALKGITDASGLSLDEKEKEMALGIINNAQMEAMGKDTIKKILEDESFLEIAVTEWAATSALYRATGITGPVGLKQDIGDLANKVEWDQVTNQLLYERAREFNADKGHLLLGLNKRMGMVVNDAAAKEMEPEDLLIALDKRTSEVMLPALMKLFKEMSKEPAYRDLYSEKTIRGRKHVLVKGFVDPTVQDVQNLVVLFKKELPQKKGRLKEIVTEELKARGVSADDAAAAADSYIGFYDAISYAYALLHPGAYPSREAMHKYVWIQEIGNNYMACPKFTPDYETMGEADKIVNGGVMVDEKGHKVLLPVKDTFARKAAAFLTMQGNQFLTGAYIGTMAEAAASAVFYTRHGAYLKTMIKPYHGKDGFSEDVTRNAELAEKLLEAYKLRYILENRKHIDDTEMEKILKHLNPEELRRALYDELEAIREKMDYNNKELGLSKMSVEELENAIREGEQIISDKVKAGTIDAEVLKIVDQMDDKLDVLREYKEVVRSLEAIKGIKFDGLTRADLDRNAIRALDVLNRDLDVVKKSMDTLIGECKPHVGEYVMQELLNDLVVKSGYRLNESKEELAYISNEIDFVDNVARTHLLKEIEESIDAMGLAKEKSEMLKQHLDGIDTIDSLGREFGKMMRTQEMIKNAINTDIATLDEALRNMPEILSTYGQEINSLKDENEEWASGLDAVRKRLLAAVSKVPEKKNTAAVINAGIAAAKVEDACNEATASLMAAKKARTAAGKSTTDIDAELAKMPDILDEARKLDRKGADISSRTRVLATSIMADERLHKAFDVLSRSDNPQVAQALDKLREAKDIGKIGQAFYNALDAIKLETNALVSSVLLMEKQEEMLNIEIKDRIDALVKSKKRIMARKEKTEVNIKIESQITPKFIFIQKFWKSGVSTAYGTELLRKMWHYIKGKFIRQEKSLDQKYRSYESGGNFVREAFEFSEKVKAAGKELTEFEKIMNQHARNHAYIIEKFLVRSYGLYTTFEAGMHTRRKNYGLSFSGEAGYQFAGPMPSTLIQQVATYGRFGNAGWFTSMLLAYPIRKAQRIYARRYPLLKLMSGIPAVYDPMKNTGSTFKGTVKGLITALLYMRYKSKYAKMGESIRATSKDMAPRVFLPYLLTSNPYGEMRMSELFESMGDNFRASPRGPRDILNYLLYKPNDLVVDFQDIIYSMKDGRSMKKTPEHLMDIGMYGVVGNSGFIAGREINFINTALGGPESMYPNRAFNMFNYNPQLSLPQMRYAAYGDIYKRTSNPVDVAEETVHMIHHADRLMLEPLVVPPLILTATFFGGYAFGYFWNDGIMRAISTVMGSKILMGMGTTSAIWKMYRYEKLNSLKHTARMPYMSDEWKTYIKFSERMRNMHMGTYKSEVFYHE